MTSIGSSRPWPVLVVAALVAATASLAYADPRPCGAEASPKATTQSGWQVQLDPETGTYSMPAPGALPAATARSSEAATAAVVVTPGTTAAGGFKATFGTPSTLQKGGE